MQQTAWISLTALIAAIVAIGLGIAALVLALDDDGPQFPRATATFGVAPAVPDFDQRPRTPALPQRGLDEFRERIEQALPLDSRPLLGVGVSEADDGVRIDSVAEASPAAEAGLEAGDVITAVGDRSVASVEALSDAINAHEPGDEISLTVDRDGETQEFDVTLAERRRSFRFEIPGDFEFPDGRSLPFPGPGGNVPQSNDSTFAG